MSDARPPRLTPLTEAEWNDDARAILGPLAAGDGVLNIFATLARHPKLLKRWLVFGGHVLGKSSLPARERELLILRVGHLCQSRYEIHQHARIALDSGVSEAEVARTALDASHWEGDDAVLIAAVDELHATKDVSDATWQALSSRWSEHQLLDLLFTVGQYTMVSMVLNTLGIQIEPGQDGGA